jgi:hypothetical protein
MSRVRRGLFVLAGIVSIGGCLNPSSTRMPRFETGSPRAEKVGLQQHDPFPSSTAGPDTFSRPRGFNQQRTEIRRIREAELLRGMNREQNLSSPQVPAAELEYPNTVRQ